MRLRSKEGKKCRKEKKNEANNNKRKLTCTGLMDGKMKKSRKQGSYCVGKERGK